MKLMNPLLAECVGAVEEVLVGNGEPVEFDQPLIIVVQEESPYAADQEGGPW
jgi:biotin carboxyl carrier protein